MENNNPKIYEVIRGSNIKIEAIPNEGYALKSIRSTIDYRPLNKEGENFIEVSNIRNNPTYLVDFARIEDIEKHQKKVRLTNYLKENLYPIMFNSVVYRCSNKSRPGIGYDTDHYKTLVNKVTGEHKCVANGIILKDLPEELKGIVTYVTVNVSESRRLNIAPYKIDLNGRHFFLPARNNRNYSTQINSEVHIALNKNFYIPDAIFEDPNLYDFNNDPVGPTYHEFSKLGIENASDHIRQSSTSEDLYNSYIGGLENITFTVETTEYGTITFNKDMYFPLSNRHLVIDDYMQEGYAVPQIRYITK